MSAAPGPTLEFRLATDTDNFGWKKMELRGSDKPIFVSSDVSVDGSHIEKVSFYNDQKGNPSVGITLTDSGARIMETTTSENIHKRLAIVLDGEVVSAPVIQSTITKEAQITGRLNKEELIAFFHAIVLHEIPSAKHTGVSANGPLKQPPAGVT